MAETTTTTSLPAFLAAATFAATSLIRSIEATEVPPYFCTNSATQISRQLFRIFVRGAAFGFWITGIREQQPK
jgi:hypothetical protein